MAHAWGASMGGCWLNKGFHLTLPEKVIDRTNWFYSTYKTAKITNENEYK